MNDIKGSKILVIEGAGFIGSHVVDELTKAAGQTFVSSHVGSTEKAQKDLGFEAKTTLEDGLRSLIEWRRRDLGQTLRDRV